MKYYVINFESVKEVDKKTFLKLDNAHLDRDYITWYNDGENIFIGVCSNDIKNVIYAIVKATGVFNADYYEAGEIY